MNIPRIVLESANAINNNRDETNRVYHARNLAAFILEQSAKGTQTVGKGLVTLEQFTWPEIASASSMLPLMMDCIAKARAATNPDREWEIAFTTNLGAVDLLTRIAKAYVSCTRAEPLQVAESIYAALQTYAGFRLSTEETILKIVNELTIPGLKR